MVPFFNEAAGMHASFLYKQHIISTQPQCYLTL